MGLVIYPRIVTEVLLEYEGPQLVVKKDAANNLYLALAVDDGPGFVRWIEAPISDLEREGIKRGGEPIRDVFLKGTVTIADYARDNNAPIAARDIPGVELPDSVLPRPRVVLEFEPDEPLAPIRGIAGPAFHFHGDGPVPNSIRFGQLVAAAQTLQGFWNAAADAIFQASTSILYALVPVPGSWTIPIHTDNVALFEQVAMRYRELALTVGDEQAFRAALSSSPLAVAASFEEHLKALELQELEVLADWRGGAAFIGPQSAKRARLNLAEPAELPGALRSIPKSFRGYFESFWRSGQRTRAFEFYDIDSGRTIFGAFSEEMRRKIAEQDFVVILGRGTSEYRVDTLEEQSDPPKYVLVNIHPPQTAT
jgi:hypothetical protein